MWLDKISGTNKQRLYLLRDHIESVSETLDRCRREHNGSADTIRSLLKGALCHSRLSAVQSSITVSTPVVKEIKTDSFGFWWCHPLVALYGFSPTYTKIVGKTVNDTFNM